MIKEIRVRPRRRVVKLIHDDDIKVIRTKMLEAGCRKALNRCKHMLEPLWYTPANPEFPEGRFP